MSHDHHDDQPHALPLSLLFGIFVALLVLTFITVAVTWVDLGEFNLWIALLVAVVKAALVGLYFMHLRYDAPFNSIALIASFLFVALFIGFALLDSKQYQPEHDTPRMVEDVANQE